MPVPTYHQVSFFCAQGNPKGLERANDVTLILAILGAVSGLTGTTVSVLTYRRSRPIIVVKSLPSGSWPDC